MKNKNKFLTRLVSFAVCLVSLFCLVSCGTTNSDDSQYVGRPNRVDVTIFNGGYGYEWMQKVAKYYMDNVDTSTYVKVIDTVMDGNEINNVGAGLARSDIYVLDGFVDPKAGTVLDLTDVYNSYPTGESQYTILEKCEDVAKYYKDDSGKYYFMPWGSKYGYSFMYNKTTIDNALGVGNWTLPRTTTEFFEFGDKLVDKGVYLYAGSFRDGFDYLFMGEKVWFAQAIGLDAYEKYMSGEYYDGAEWKLSTNSPKMIEDNKEAIESFYGILKQFAEGTGYVHSNSKSMEFTDIEVAFAGYGFGRNKAKVAFIFEGPWGQNEIEHLCKVIGSPFRDITGSMKMPVNSDIIKRTPSIKNDETLRLVIDYVDGKTQTKPVGVTDNDIAIVEEARSLIGNGYSMTMMIPSNTNAEAKAKEFLKFLATDTAQQITIDAVNGISVLPYDYKTTVNPTKSVPNFAVECKNNAKGANFIIQNNAPYKFASITGLDCYYGTYNILYAIFGGTETRTPEQYYNDMYNYFNVRWANCIDTYNSLIK